MSLYPALNNASVSVSCGVFLLNVTASSTTGLAMDLNIPDQLQGDLSITLANGSSVNLSLLPQPQTPSSQQAEIDDVLGTVTQVSGRQVTRPAGTTYAVGTAGCAGVSVGTFTSAMDLMPGQEVVLNVASKLTTGSAMAFNTSSTYLESSQVVGKIASVNNATASLVINSLSGLFTGSRPAVQQMNVQTDADTAYVGCSPSSFTALATGQLLSAKGPCFNTISTSSVRTLSAIQIRARTVGN
ncbi:MAG TPA: hypothetical protein VIJ38_13775 [Acidobacteriaceae bacterium]